MLANVGRRYIKEVSKESIHAGVLKKMMQNVDKEAVNRFKRKPAYFDYTKKG